MFLSPVAAAQEQEWALTLGGYYGEMSFADPQDSVFAEVKHTDDRRRSLWLRGEYTHKFNQDAYGGAIGTAFPVPLPHSAVTLEVAAAPEQDIVPKAIIDVSFIHDPTSRLELISRYRYAHYSVSNIHLLSPGLIWMPHDRLQASAVYYFTHTEFTGPRSGDSNHSYSLKLLVRPRPFFHPWVAYTRSSEAFEAGDAGVGAFYAHHYLVGANLPLTRHLEFRGHFEYESRDNNQILRTGTLSTVLTW